MMLYTLEITLALYYFRLRAPSTIYKCGIATLLFADTICTMAICANVVLYAIVFPAKGGFPTVQQWPLPVMIISTFVAAGVEQTFLVHRFWML